jgi:hypothetical protein
MPKDYDTILHLLERYRNGDYNKKAKTPRDMRSMSLKRLKMRTDTTIDANRIERDRLYRESMSNYSFGFARRHS